MTAPDASERAGERPILLVGMMGCGKSTVGPALARLLGRDFVDVDREIEARSGRSIAEIFEAEGEPAFRELERRTIDELARGSGVLALGGGAIAQPGAPERLARIGTVVHLRARLETLVGRVGRADRRPLLAGLSPAERRERLAEMLQARRSAYDSAAVAVDTDDRGPDDIARSIAGRLAQEPGGEAP